jgi:hypothetical protein
MPGEPIDEYSVRLNLDASEAVEGLIDAVSEMEGAIDDIVEAAQALGDLEYGDSKAALEFFEALEVGGAQALFFAQAVTKAVEAGADMEAAYVAAAAALQDTNTGLAQMVELQAQQEQEEFNETMTLGKSIIEDVTAAWEEQTGVIPIEKMVALARNMEKVIEQGELLELNADQVRKRMIQLGQDALPPLQGVKNNLLDIATTIGRRFGIDVPQALGRVQQIMGGMDKAATALKISTAGLGAAFAVLATAILGVLAVGALYFKWLQEGAALALRNAEIHERLALAARIQQQEIGELALSHREAVDAASELAENFGLTQIKAESLLATAINLTRQFKLSGEETTNLAEAAAILGKAAGVDAESALRSVTNFMLTGYTQGLQQLGITISDTEIHHRAYEQRLVTLTQEVDEATKAEIARQIIMEEAEKQRELAIESTDTYAQSIASSTDEINTAKESLGELLIPFKALAKEVEAKVITVLIKTFQSLIAAVLIAQTSISTFFESVGDTIDEFFRRVREGESLGGIFSFFKENTAEKLEENIDDIGQSFRDWLNVADDTKEGTAGLGETFEELKDRIHGAAIEIGKDIMKLDENFQTSMSSIAQRFRDAMAKIDVDFGRRRTDAAVDFNRDIRDIDDNAREQAIDAARTFNEREMRLEEDHKLRMLQLEERFLFELEDAVRERDARGVLMALRRHNQEKKEAERDKGIREKRLREDFALELAEIERERMRRREERFQEFIELNDDLAIQEARRREDARTHE